jgi:hypothetical protein
LDFGGINRLVSFLYPPGELNFPDLSPTTIFEYIQRDPAVSVPKLVAFMQTTAAIVGAWPTPQQVQQVENTSAALGATLQPEDASVVASALIDGVPLLTNDTQEKKYLTRINWPFEDWGASPIPLFPTIQ